MAARPMSGAVTTSATAAQTMSKRRLTMMQGAAHGHEDLGRFDALLVAPRERAIAERVERAGMGVVAQLARVAGHRGELHLERRGDVDPRVGGEAARKGPFGAARRVERIQDRKSTRLN